ALFDSCLSSSRAAIPDWRSTDRFVRRDGVLDDMESNGIPGPGATLQPYRRPTAGRRTTGREAIRRRTHSGDRGTAGGGSGALLSLADLRARSKSWRSLRATLSATSAVALLNFAPPLSCVVDQITSPSLFTSRSAVRASCLRSVLLTESRSLIDMPP